VKVLPGLKLTTQVPVAEQRAYGIILWHMWEVEEATRYFHLPAIIYKINESVNCPCKALNYVRLLDAPEMRQEHPDIRHLSQYYTAALTLRQSSSREALQSARAQFTEVSRLDERVSLRAYSAFYLGYIQLALYDHAPEPACLKTACASFRTAIELIPCFGFARLMLAKTILRQKQTIFQWFQVRRLLQNLDCVYGDPEDHELRRFLLALSCVIPGGVTPKRVRRCFQGLNVLTMMAGRGHTSAQIYLDTSSFDPIPHCSTPTTLPFFTLQY
jgi:hypothetical protein